MKIENLIKPPKKYAVAFFVIVFLAQLLELASDKIGNSIVYRYFMIICYVIMAFLILTMKKDKSKSLSLSGKIKKSLLNHPLHNLIIDTKKGYTDISKKLLSDGDVPEEPKKLEDNTNQLKN